eukprot:4640876-Heterocapsa_arctica.AAC.1
MSSGSSCRSRSSRPYSVGFATNVNRLMSAHEVRRAVVSRSVARHQQRRRQSQQALQGQPSQQPISARHAPDVLGKNKGPLG